MKRILLILVGLALMLGQSSSPTGLMGAAATSNVSQPATFSLHGSEIGSAITSPNGKADAQNIVAIGAVVANVAAASGNKEH